MEMINDIAPITTSEYGSFLEILIYIGVAIILFVVLNFVAKLLNSKKEKKDSAFDALDLENINKETLYNFTVIAKKAKRCEGLESLLEKLEPYKYKPNSEAISEEIGNEIREYIEKCRA
jgi:hypothetical protein